MTSTSLLLFDSVEIDEWRGHVPDEVIALFQEQDREIWSYDEEAEKICYSASRDVVLQRLDVMGVTSEAARAAFESWKNELIESLGNSYIEVEGKVVCLAGPVHGLTYENWQQRVPVALASRFSASLEDPVSAKMQDTSSGWMPFSSYDYRISIRALLEAAGSVKNVILDVRELVRGGYFDADLCIASQLRSESAARRPVLEPIVIIAEGSSDIRILESSLPKLFPHLDQYFSFFDHNELNVDGGAEFLVKLIKAFATPGMYVRMIAVFDNDAAGIAAATKARTLELPGRIQILTLPDLDLARAYPTVGPQGEHDVDVNGRAASIELYLGRHNLLGPDQRLIPVRWSGLLGAERYQGAIVDKRAVYQAFMTSMEACTDSVQARNDYPELVAIWNEIFALARQG